MQPISPVTIICISDTHNAQIDVPPGDMLIHTGDLTQSGTLKELEAALGWLRSLPHPHKVIIGGNHDLILDSTLTQKENNHTSAQNSRDRSRFTYLNNTSTTIKCDSGRELKIFGSPMTPRHGNWAFQYPRNEDVWKDLVPDDVDILVTHGPPKAHLDHGGAGCDILVAELWRIQPRLHVFGHIHAGYGQELVQYNGLQEAYEAAAAAGGGMFKLGRVLFEFVMDFLRPARESRGLLVNASIVGGLRDEIRRPAMRVSI
jgi:predicted phosphohydrolase